MRYQKYVFFYLIAFAISFVFFQAHAAASFVNSWTSNKKVTSTADFSVAKSITPTSGNLLIMFIVSRQNLVSTPTISGWTSRGSRCSPTSTACIYSYSKISTGSESVSVLLDNQDNPNSATLTILEYSGALNILNTSNTNFGTGTSITTGNITTSNVNELLISTIAIDSNTNHALWSNSFIQRSNNFVTGKNTQLKALTADLLTNNVGTYSTGTTINKSENWSTMIFNFATTESTTSDLRLTKTVSNTHPSVSQPFSYTISLFNSGARNNTNVQVFDTMPSGITIISTSPSSGTTYNSGTGIWNVGTINSGQTLSLSITAYATAILSGTSIVNTTNISAYDITDPNLSNNSSSVSINIKEITSAPSINSPSVSGDTVISGASTDAEGAEIYVYNGNTLIGNSTLSGGTWAANVITVSAGDSIRAKSVVAGCCESILSNPIIVLAKTAIPTITVPVIAGATLIKGVTSEANGTSVEVFVNNLLIGTTTSSGGNWELSVPKATLQTGEQVKVRATASGKYVSGYSENVTVINAESPIPAITTPIVAGDLLIIGTSLGSDGTVIEVFKTRGGVTSSIGITTVSSNQWALLGIDASEIRANDVFTSKARIDTNNDGLNDSSDTYSSSSPGITASLRTSQIPSVNELNSGETLVSGGSAGSNGTLIKIYKNNTYLSSANVNNNLWSTSTATLVFGDTYKATATYDNDNNGVIDGSDTESGFSSTVTVGGSPVTQVPILTEPIVAGDTIIFGETSEDSGTIIKVYVGGVSVGSLATSSLFWNLSIPQNTLQTGELVTAKATATGKSESNTSQAITVINKIPPTPTVNQAKAGATTVSGSVIVNGNSIIEVLVNGIQVSTTSVSSNSWSISVASTELQTGEVITARTHIDYNNDGIIELDDASSALSLGVSVINRVSPIPSLNPIGLNSKTITGQLSPIAVTKIFVYRLREGTRTLLGTTQTNSPSFFLDELISNPWKVGDSITATSITDTNNDGVVDLSDIESIDSESQIIFDDSVFLSNEDKGEGCSDIKPNGSPTIYRIEKTGDTKFKIYFNPLNHPRDNFEYEHVDLLTGIINKGDIKNFNLGYAEISNLFNGKIRIRAENGCKKGDWSEYEETLQSEDLILKKILSPYQIDLGEDSFKTNLFFDEEVKFPFQTNPENLNIETNKSSSNIWGYLLGAISMIIIVIIVILFVRYRLSSRERK